MEKMSITRALAEKKLLGKKIEQHFSKFVPMAVVIGENVPVGFKNIRDFDAYCRSNYDELRDELARYNRIVQAIAESNSKTEVTICGERLTVTRALEKKKFYSTILAQYLIKLKSYFQEKEKEYQKLLIAEKMKEDAEFDTFVGKDKGLKEEELKVAKKIISERHTVHFLDPLNIREIIEKMDKEQTDFLMNVDIVLTESNSKTEIDI